MENTRKKREFFDKNYLIKHVGIIRNETMLNKKDNDYFIKNYPALYHYKVIFQLRKLGYLKVNSVSRRYFYKWNFDSKVSREDIDFIFKESYKIRNEIINRINKNKNIKNQELINSQQKANLKVEEPILEPVKEVAMEEIELPAGFQMWNLVAQARYLGLVPTEEEVQAWKKEIEYLKDELKNKIEALTRQQTANKSYKKRIFETEENLNQSLKIIKIQDNKIQGYENSLNSQKVSAESYKKRFEDAQKSLDEAKKVIKEQEIEIEVLEQKKSFKSIKPKIEPKEVKYFKLFGIKIYEKN